MLAATGMDVIEHTGRYQEFAEQTATPARTLYAAPARRTPRTGWSRSISPLPDTMRAPGEAPGLLGDMNPPWTAPGRKPGHRPIELRIPQ